MRLIWSLIKKDIKRNKVITVVLAVFLTLSAVMMAGGLRVAGTMLSSMNSFNKLAIPPDYLQMHKGIYDETAFEAFVSGNQEIEQAQIVKMLDVSNAGIVYQGETFERCLMDNSLIVQNNGFDYLLNTENEVASVKEGEIGVPVYYAEELGIQIGDELTLRTGDYEKQLIVAVIIRDASMNVALTSSKRFLVTQADLDEISGNMGEWEYCIEFMLKEGVDTSAFESAYMNSGLPSNGVAITGAIINMMSVLSYGLVAFIILAISILLVLIAALCLSYIIRATMMEERITIGDMKAIGFPMKELVKLYQMKYMLLMVFAVVIGYLAAIPFGQYFSDSVVRYCGEGTTTWMIHLFPFIGLILLSLLVLGNCHRNLKRCLKRTVVELKRGDDSRKEGRYALPKELPHRNLTIALGELMCKWKEYLILFFVFVFAQFLVLLPLNMKHTVENPSFITYMGVGECDIRIDLQYSEQLTKQKELLEGHLQQDPDTTRYSIYQNGYVQSLNAEQKWVYIRVESGDESIFPLAYLEGAAPLNKNEIALSYLEAKELDKAVGDVMSVTYQGKEVELIVSGIYQDITYGGKTAKTSIEFEPEDIEVYILYVDVKDSVSITNKSGELRTLLSSGKVTPVSEFISQTLGGILDNMGQISQAAILISFLLTVLITVMFLQLIMAREHSAIAVKKAIGYSNKDIRIQYGIRILVLQCLAVVTGTILANSLGEMIFGWMLASMGAAKITMLVEPVTAYAICPGLQLIAVLITVVVKTKVVRKYHIREQIVE